MKKKRWVTLVASIFVILVLLFMVICLSGNKFTVARCIVTDSDSLYMVYDDRPIHLNYNKESAYQTGDKLLIIHSSAFAESYPEQARAYFIMKIDSGSKEDIPQKAIDVLIETGNWKE